MRGTVGLVAVALLLGGCASGAAEPAPTTIGAVEPSVAAAPTEASVEASVEASAEPGVRAPEMPALAREQTPEGAVAFAEWWYSMLDYATTTGDVEPLARASHADCGSCDSLIADIETSYIGGGSIDGGAITAKASSPGAVEDLGVLLAVQVSAQPLQYRDSAGNVTREVAAESFFLDVSLLKGDGGWLFASATRPS